MATFELKENGANSVILVLGELHIQISRDEAMDLARKIQKHFGEEVLGEE